MQYLKSREPSENQTHYPKLVWRKSLLTTELTAWFTQPLHLWAGFEKAMSLILKQSSISFNLVFLLLDWLPNPGESFQSALLFTHN